MFTRRFSSTTAFPPHALAASFTVSVDAEAFERTRAQVAKDARSGTANGGAVTSKVKTLAAKTVVASEDEA